MATSSSVSSITWGGTSFPAVGSASVSITKPPMETTEIGSAVQSYIAGITGGTASLDVFFDGGTAIHETMTTDMLAGTSKAFALVLSGSTTVSGTAFVSKFDPTASAMNVTRASIELTFTGAITIA